jgi:ketosteroid isomerase-like protein
MLRSIFLSAVFTAVIPVMNVLPAYEAPRGNAVGDAKAEVMQAEESRNQALQKGDADALAKLYTNDLIYTNAFRITLTKEQHLTDIRNRKLKLTAFKHSNVEVRVHGNTGFVTGISTSMVDFHGNVSDSPRKFLNTYFTEAPRPRCILRLQEGAMPRKLRDCFDLARKLFVYARREGSQESISNVDRLKAKLDHETRRRTSGRPEKRPLPDCFDLARGIYPYTADPCAGDPCVCGYAQLSDRLDQECIL